MGKHYEYEKECSGLFESVTALCERMDREHEFQKNLSPNDPRNWEMFEFVRDEHEREFAVIYWGGYEYTYEVDRITAPEDLLWLIVHLSEKEWKHFAGYRVAAFIEAIACKKNWPKFGKVRHVNEAPPANKSKERAKLSSVMRYDVITRDGYRCRACGFSVQDGAHLHVDHIVSISKGGRTERSNLQTLCTSCNLGKGAR